MKLHTIINESAQLAYHVSPALNLRQIQAKGLVANATTRAGHAGKGIYIFFREKEAASDIAEYIGLEDFILITVQVDTDQLLMDEDTLLITPGGHEVKDLAQIMPPTAVLEYKRYLQRIGEDDAACNDLTIAKFKVNLINKYQIRPHPEWLTEWGHYSMATARSVAPMMSVTAVEWYEPESGELLAV